MIGKQSKKLDVIGTNASVEIAGHKDVPAKIDTGAHSSSVWASHIKVKDGVLHFVFFDKDSQYYTGKTIEHKDFRTVKVRSSNGQSEDRYVVRLPLKINDREIRATFTLADRSKNRYPILIGCRALRGKFVVDVSQQTITPPPEPEPTAPISKPENKETNTKKSDSKKITVKKEAPAKKSVPKKSHLPQIFAAMLAKNDFQKVATSKTHCLYFEKYKNSYAIANALYYIFNLWKIKGVDLRDKFLKFYPLARLRSLSSRLLTDPKALLYLSKYAVNIICLTEIMYPRERDVVNKLARIAMTIDPDAQPALYVELCIQIIIADSHYFRRPLSDCNRLLLRQLLRRASVYRKSFSNEISNEVKQKFRACEKLVSHKSTKKKKALK